MKLPTTRTVPEYIPFKGGLDLELPSISKYPGALDICKNYVADSSGGYSRVDGYERYSGQPSPSAAVYYYVPFTATDTVAVGDDVTGADSGATGTVVTVGTGYINITKVVGTFQEEVLNVSGSPVGSVTGDLVYNGETTPLLHATALAAAAADYRSDITAPTGSGAMRGLGILKGVLYCFRDNAGATAGLIYKATTAGWVAITLYHEISFDTGIATIADGAAVTQLVSGATAVVKRTVHESGTWGSTAAGRLILTTIVGTFSATNDIQVGGVTKMTSTSLATQIAILPGGRYELRSYNFYGSLNTRRFYGADGVNHGFEFDGDVYVPLHTGMTTDTPEYVYTFKNQLFLSFKGSSQNSGIGSPYQWTAVSGAAEIALGDDITGYIGLPGKTMGILSRNSSSQLIGSSVADYVLDSISDEVGGIARTAQRIGQAYCLDDRGIVMIYPTDKYGNFEQSTVSRRVQTLIRAMRPVVVASTVYRSKNQYRLYGSDGTGICMTILDRGHAFTKFIYPDNMVCAVSGEDTTGKNIIFLGSDEGMVYQADKGSSFDGAAIEAFIGLPYNHSKSPSNIKSYRKVIVEMTGSGYSSLSYYPSFSYGSTDIPEHPAQTLISESTGGYWDVSNWDEFFWDGVAVGNTSLSITGNGTNMALTIYGNSAIDLGHRLDGVIIHYITRRMIR